MWFSITTPTWHLPHSKQFTFSYYDTNKNEWLYFKSRMCILKNTLYVFRLYYSEDQYRFCIEEYIGGTLLFDNGIGAMDNARKVKYAVLGDYKRKNDVSNVVGYATIKINDILADFYEKEIQYNYDINSSALLVVSVDEKYLEYAKHVFFTAMKFGNWKGEYCLLALRIERDNEKLKWFKDNNIEIRHYENVDSVLGLSTDKIYRTYKDGNYWNDSTFLRLVLFFEDYFNQYDKILYLDCDTFVFDDINSIFNYKSDIYMAAEYMFLGNIAGQINVPKENPDRMILEDIKEFGDYRRFNAGVILFDPKGITEQDKEKIKYYCGIADQDYFTCVDQSVLGLVFSYKKRDLETKFNYIVNTRYLSTDIEDVPLHAKIYLLVNKFWESSWHAVYPHVLEDVLFRSTHNVFKKLYLDHMKYIDNFHGCDLTDLT
jgi:lipopolysaccharide biosynthesis glycosyltransferase